MKHQDRSGREAAVEDCNVDGIFFFAFKVLTDAERRFEQHLYPAGLTYEPDRAFLFRPLELTRGEERSVVEPIGIEPTTS